MPLIIASTITTAPRRNGQRSTGSRLTSGIQALSLTTTLPSGRRTAITIASGPRIMTPSRIAWPPTFLMADTVCTKSLPRMERS